MYCLCDVCGWVCLWEYCEEGYERSEVKLIMMLDECSMDIHFEAVLFNCSSPLSLFSFFCTKEGRG